MKLPEKYPNQFANSVLKVSAGQVKFFGWGSMIMSIVFSSSLILGLPLPAIIGFFVIIAVAILYVMTSPRIKAIKIPADLAVDYIEGTGAVEEVAE